MSQVFSGFALSLIMSCGAPETERERDSQLWACGGGVVVMMDAQFGRCCLHSFSFIPGNFCKTRVRQITPKISLSLFHSKQRKNQQSQLVLRRLHPRSDGKFLTYALAVIHVQLTISMRFSSTRQRFQTTISG